MNFKEFQKAFENAPASENELKRERMHAFAYMNERLKEIETIAAEFCEAITLEQRKEALQIWDDNNAPTLGPSDAENGTADSVLNEIGTRRDLLLAMLNRDRANQDKLS